MERFDSFGLATRAISAKPGKSARARPRDILQAMNSVPLWFVGEGIEGLKTVTTARRECEVM